MANYDSNLDSIKSISFNSTCVLLDFLLLTNNYVHQLLENL